MRIPVPIVLGSDAWTGTITIPIFSVLGYMGSEGGTLLVPPIVVSGTSQWYGSTGALEIHPVSVLGTGTSPYVHSGSIVIPNLHVSGFSSSGSIGALTIPAIIVTDIPLSHSRASIDIPVIGITGFGRSVTFGGVSSNVYLGMAVNLNNQAVSEYRNFKFNSFAYFNGHYYGANELGIYKLEGNKDDGTYINAKIKTGAMNFGNQFMKYVHDAWLTFRSNGTLALVLLVDEDEDHPSSELHTTISGMEVHEERIKTPKGLRGRYVTVELRNKSGAYFDLDAISLLIEAIKRKPR
jgi:hypothetical protein